MDVWHHESVSFPHQWSRDFLHRHTSSACPLEVCTANTPVLPLSSNAQLLKLTLNG